VADISSSTTMAVFSGISAIMLGWIGVGVQRQKNAAEQSSDLSRQTLARFTEERQRMAGQRDVELKVYDAVVGALQEGSSRRQLVAHSLVNAMVIDTVLRGGLLQALLQQATPAVKESIGVDINFDQATREARTLAAHARPAASNRVGRVDLFWCESSGPDAERVMKAVRSDLLGKGFSQNAVRVRRLPASINSRPGYNVAGYQVRFESEEQQSAELVQQEIAAKLGARGGAVAQVVIEAQTPGYLSAFACPVTKEKP